MNHLKREQFFWNFTEKGTIPNCYESILINDYSIFNKGETPLCHNAIYVSLFPRFLKPVIVNKNYSIKKLKHVQFPGAGINLENAIDVDSHIKTFLPSSFRSNLKRLKKRLETCFSITYKMYHGNIEQENCAYLINLLFELQVKRLNQKKLQNNLSSKYENYKKIVCPLINEGKATLFVIYNNDMPIGITLNFLQEKIYFGALTAYNIDYAKFGIGNILMYKQLDWCIKNKYLYFDMGNGDINYKKKWSNSIYDFEYHIIYKSKSILAFSIACLESGKIYAKNLIKTLNIGEHVRHVFRSKKKHTEHVSALKTEHIKNISSIEDLNISSIKLENNLYNTLKKPFFNFLFSYSEHYDTTSIYKINNEANAFVFKGINNALKIWVS